MNISILGAGEIGKAIANSLSINNQINLWDKYPGKVNDQKNLDEIIPNSEIIFFCIPSSGIIEALNTVKPMLHQSAVIVSLTKGIEAERGKFVYQIFEENLNKEQYALLSGPMLAEELAKGQGAAAVVATESTLVFKKLLTIFKPNYLRLEHSINLRSVALAGVLKNIYTLILGINDGLGYGSNSKGFLVSHILPEFEAICQRLNIDHEIMYGTAGLADFIATAFSLFSLNREAGIKIAQGMTPPQSEGLAALPSLLKILPHHDDLPILTALKKIIMGRQKPKPILDEIIYSQK